MELKARNVQHARNLLDRAVTILPRVDQLWYKYVYLEELLQNVAGARQVFERWMKWEPEDKAWQAYIKMEERYGELDRASGIFERWIAVRPDPRIWVKWAKFEEDRAKVESAREVFRTALEFFGDDMEQIEKAQAVLIAFAKMESRYKQYERAREIYKFALDRLPQRRSGSLYASYTQFEKQHGTPSTLDCTVLAKRRIQYEDDLARDGQNYDAWFDYVRLEEEATISLKEDGANNAEMDEAVGRVRELYERAVSHVPPSDSKRHWRRYIYLWLYYGRISQRITSARDRSIIPHSQSCPTKFLHLPNSGSRLRILKSVVINLLAARKLLDDAIEICPKEKLFKEYIKLEESLREFDRERGLYEKYIQFDPTNSSAWIAYAQLEASLGDHSRARAIYDLALGQEQLSMPENLWKAYLDFEIEQGERERARALYERLIGLSGDVKVWSSFAEFEAASIPVNQSLRGGFGEEDVDNVETVEGDVNLARQIFHRGLRCMKDKGSKMERCALLKAWEIFEQQHGTSDDVARVNAMMPILDPVNVLGGEATEVSEMIFPDDVEESNSASYKFVQMARMWKDSRANQKAMVASYRGNTTPELPESEEPTENASGGLGDRSKRTVLTRP